LNGSEERFAEDWAFKLPRLNKLKRIINIKGVKKIEKLIRNFI
jgi:hypothetical protein